ncbi:hypothetical protein DESUT3_37050 [Desulfuromonas versatilis]|uniref:Flagellar assembly protein FliH n=1 Tax=Desulfuromonas versatilis TaxID=2802975 RepID=A0ABN6E2P0_9BACT|nr:flagellar assembly protein FliH [Desulfuromonas versatilis]BCR06636.1 hypothetical protein DESUT3_37050 [Desulfuromonas versatilis]
MSLSRVLKGAAVEGLQTLRFVDFDGEGAGSGGMEPADEEFQPAAIGRPATGVAPQGARPDPQPVAAPNLEREKEEAFARGRQEGIQQTETRLGETVKAFAAGLESIHRLRESILKNSTDDMLRLVMAIAEQVVSCEIATNPEIVFHTLQKALHAAVRSDAFHVRVNPADFALVQEKKPLLLAGISGLKNITFEADASVSRGGCLVESELGEVDASIESQLEEIRQKTLAAAAGE